MTDGPDAIEVEYPEPWETFDDDDSHVLGERRIEYVEPTWVRLSSDDDDAELSKCACCSRFFVQATPLRLFQDLGDGIVLGFEVCEQCAPKVMRGMRNV